MRNFFNTAWGSTTSIAWDDVSFIPPSNATWVRCTIKHFDGYQASIGSYGANNQRRTGAVVIQIFAPQNKASEDARDKADLAITAFTNGSVDGILFLDVHAEEIGADSHGYYQINVIANFQYDDVG